MSLTVHCGTTPEGHKVSVTDDDGGPQIIIKSESIHLISLPFERTSNAIQVARSIVLKGHDQFPGCNWVNVTGNTEVVFFGSPYRGFAQTK
jgi:hypothetical protein